MSKATAVSKRADATRPQHAQLCLVRLVECQRTWHGRKTFQYCTDVRAKWHAPLRNEHVSEEPLRAKSRPLSARPRYAVRCFGVVWYMRSPTVGVSLRRAEFSGDGRLRQHAAYMVRTPNRLCRTQTTRGERDTTHTRATAAAAAATNINIFITVRSEGPGSRALL